MHSLRGMKISAVLVRRAEGDRYNLLMREQPAKRLITDQEHQQEQWQQEMLPFRGRGDGKR
jgi:hypothetical protein